MAKCLEDLLKENYELPDPRGEAGYERWNEDYLYYLGYIDALPSEKENTPWRVSGDNRPINRNRTYASI